MPIRYLKHLTHIPCRIKVLWGVNPRFHGLYPGIGQVAYALLTRAPVAIKVLLPHAAPRLACVKPVASVHPEPGSNSPLFILFFYFSLSFRQPDQQPRIVPASALFFLLTEGFRPLPSSCLFIASFQCSLRRFLFGKRLQRYCLYF